MLFFLLMFGAGAAALFLVQQLDIECEFPPVPKWKEERKSALPVPHLLVRQF